MMIFMICSLHSILSAWSKQEKTRGFDREIWRKETTWKT